MTTNKVTNTTTCPKERTMNVDERKLSEAIQVASSIYMRLSDIGNGLSKNHFSSCEYGDMMRRLKEIEDRLYRRGEYAPENVAVLR